MSQRRLLGQVLVAWPIRLGIGLLGFLLLLVALRFVIFHLFIGAGEGMVTSPLREVRTPLEGVVDCPHSSGSMPEVGDLVAAGQPLARVSCDRVDLGQLAGWEMRRTELAARQSRLRLELEHVRKKEDALRALTKKHHEVTLSDLRSAIDELNAQSEKARVEWLTGDRRYQEARQLNAQQVMSRRELDSEYEAVSVRKSQTTLVEATLARRQGELKAFEQDIPLREWPQCRNWAEQLEYRVPLLHAELEETIRLAKRVDLELQTERQRVKRLQQATLTAPCAGVVWQQLTTPGQQVRAQEVVHTIADPSDIIVESSFDQRWLTSVEPGTSVTVLFRNGKTMQGQVFAVRTLGPLQDQVRTVQRIDSDFRRMRVFIRLQDVPPEEAASLIGRHVRVFRSDSWLRPLLAWLLLIP